MPIIYRYLADAVVLVHFAYVAFILVGLWVLLIGWAWGWTWIRNRWFRFAHLTAIAIVVFEAWSQITCPLTIWEQELRELAGQSTYQGAFLANAIHDVLFVDLSPAVLKVTYSVVGALVLLTFVAVPPASRTRTASSEEGLRTIEHGN